MSVKRISRNSFNNTSSLKSNKKQSKVMETIDININDLPDFGSSDNASDNVLKELDDVNTCDNSDAEDNNNEDAILDNNLPEVELNALKRLNDKYMKTIMNINLDLDDDTEYSDITNSFYVEPYMGGKWNDIKHNYMLMFSDYDKLTYRMLRHSNKSDKAKCIDQLKRKQYYNMKGLNTIGLYEHYFAEQEYFHLIYDVDEVHNEKEYLEAMSYFKDLQQHLGKYSISEYTTDETLSVEHDIPLIDNDDDGLIQHLSNDTATNINTKVTKYYSAHVVFYEKRIHISLLKELFATYKNKKTNKTEFLNDGIKYQDISIWRDLCNGKGRLMRVAISDKINGHYDKTNKTMIWESYKPTHTIVTDADKQKLPLSTNLITIPLPQIFKLPSITKDDLIACGIIFNKLEDKQPSDKSQGIVRHKYERKSTAATRFDKNKLKDFELITDEHNLITMDYDELEDLIDLIHDDAGEMPYELGYPVADILAHQACHVFTDKERLAETVTNSYNKAGKHSNPNSLAAHINTYYGQDAETNASNKWFYSLLKYINPNEKEALQQLKDKYSIGIRSDITANSYNPVNEFTINHCYRKAKEGKYNLKVSCDEDEHEYVYDINGLYELINDLKRCVAYVNNNYYIIERSGVHVVAKRSLTDEYNMHPFGASCDITFANIISRYCDYFYYDELVFCSEANLNKLPQYDEEGNPIKYFNLFRGWNARDISNPEAEAMFTKILKAICNNNDEEFHEVCYRLSWIINNISHSDVVEYFQGLCGTGKGTFMKSLELFAKQYTKHVNSIDDILHENSMLEGAIFISMNELPKYNENKANDQSAFKEYITDDIIKIRDLYIKKHNAPNSCNYFVFTNNMNAISITNDDRRFNVHNTSSILTQKDFDDINKFIEDNTETYRDAVYSYLLHWIDNNSEIIKSEKLSTLLRKPMDTDARYELISITTNQYEFWIMDNPEVYNNLVTGITSWKVIGDLLTSYPPPVPRMTERTKKAWISNIKIYMNPKRTSVKIDGKPKPVYKLLDKFVDKLLPDSNDEDNEDDEDDE